jgi:uncharacterized protein (DUF2164 family)
MAIELNVKDRAAAIASLQQYAEASLAEPLGDLAAGLLLNFFVEEIGPLVYNQAIADAQTRLQLRVADLNGELFEDAFQYWPRLKSKRRR